MTHILRSTLWLLFFGSILLAWIWLYQMTAMMGIDLIGRSDPITMGASVMQSDQMGQGMEMSMTGFGPLFAMWTIMMAAMMLPTMIPTLRAYEDLIRSADGTRIGWVGVVFGYLIAWVLFAALITGVQIGLHHTGVVDMLGVAKNTVVSAALLVVVGLFQFSRTKEICHGVCHSPMTYFLGHWKTSGVGGLRMGLGLGAFCVGCCWGFMALGFVGGVMNLLWMGLATLFMVIEKLPDIGHRVTKPMGALLIVSGVLLGLSPLFTGG
ncbi:MAG: DUF2182 domain-containing protein [Paracoccaceae bacterium]